MYHTYMATHFHPSSRKKGANVPFDAIDAGERFVKGGNVWEKCSHGRGAALVSRNGSISYIGGKRHIVPFATGANVTRA